MKKIHYKRWRPLISILLLGTIMFIMFLIFQYINKSNLDSAIVAPYYEKQVFQKPADLEPKTATISAIATTQARIKIPIVMYHYVEYVADVGDFIRQKLNINPYIFERQLKALKDNNYQTYFVKDIPQIFTNQLTPATKSIVLTFDDGYEDFYYDVLPLLKKYNMKTTLYIVNDFIGRKGFLNKNQIRELIDSGLVEIGAHTLDHLYLKRLPTTVAKNQIINSKKELEEMFGIKIKTFAYPYGAFTAQTEDLVKSAQYSAAVSVIPGAAHTRADLYHLSRIRAGMIASDNINQILGGLK